jgi:hypothetical protein
MPPLVYWNAKLSHIGITSYKVFEGFQRSIHSSSLKNLLHVGAFTNETLRYLIKIFNECQTDDQRMSANDQAVSQLSQEDYVIFLQETRQNRKLNPAQSRRIKKVANKLSYYSQERIFKSQKSGNYSMKVAFLTLTCPEGTDELKSIKAFNSFLDYLRRTANCVYVWKKELGESTGKLHYHLIINNFVPYYIISWKWKRLLMAEGVQWPCKADGTHTDSHYRIELPRSKKLVSHYIAKYMSKAFDLPRAYGLISGHSAILDTLKEIDIIADDLPREEVANLITISKVIPGDFVTLILCDLLQCAKLAPLIFSAFEKQYKNFSETISLKQKFKFVEPFSKHQTV